MGIQLPTQTQVTGLSSRNMKAFISTVLLLVASASQGPVRAAPSEGTDTNSRGFFNRPGGDTVGGYNAGLSAGIVGGVNAGFGGVNPVVGGVSPSVLGGGVVPASGSVCQFWCNRGGRYVCCENSQQAHPGRCPIPRPQCPPVRAGFQGPQPCNLDIDCPFQNKCCYDTCLNDRVCKPALYF